MLLSSRLRITLVVLIILVISGMIFVSCTPISGNPSLIDKVVASNLYVYPLGMTTITCITSAAEGVSYYWSCDDGSFEGNSGSVVTWRAPNKYGKFHVMVLADNSKGIKDKASITIEVVVNTNNPSQCSTCGR